MASTLDEDEAEVTGQRLEGVPEAIGVLLAGDLREVVDGDDELLAVDVGGHGPPAGPTGCR